MPQLVLGLLKDVTFMKKIICTICSLVASIMLSGSAMAGNIPKGFEGYKDTAESVKRNITIKQGKPFLKIDYLFKKGGIVDVSELYPIISSMTPGGKVFSSRYPLFYGFNFNKDGKITPDEMYVDEKMGGMETKS